MRQGSRDLRDLARRGGPTDGPARGGVPRQRPGGHVAAGVHLHGAALRSDPIRAVPSDPGT